MNCKTKNKIRMILDIILLALTITLFNKTFINMKYHEIAGLIVIGITLIHIGINIKTAKAMCIKFTRLPLALKICIIIDILLLINFIWFGISGILCSKTILTSISSDNSVFKLYHMAAGASALVLLGIHIGLHLCRKTIPKKTAIILTIIFIAAGAYSIPNSSFMRWVSIPFNTIFSSQTTSDAKQHDNGFQERSEENQNTAEHSDNSKQNNAELGKHAADSSFTDKSIDIAMYISIIAAFSMVTYIIAIPKRRHTICANN